jgi:hypothetical protein
MKTSPWIPLHRGIYHVLLDARAALSDIGITIPRNTYAVIPSKTLSEAIRRQCLTVPGLSWEENEDSGRFVFDEPENRE